jgi:hypothetical protein
MSVVTTILLTTSIMESEEDAEGKDAFPAIDRINAGLGRPWLKQVDQHAGGNKAPQAYAFMAAINYLDLGAFKRLIREAPWEEPDHVLLLVNHEDNLGFQVEDWR